MLHHISIFSFFFSTVAEWYSNVWTYYVLFTHLPVEGRLDCLSFLSIMSKATMNNCIQVFVGICFHFTWVDSENR